MAIRQKMLVSVVCPVFNNAGHLETLLSEVKAALAAYRCELVLVDDASSDSSWETIVALARKSNNVCRVRGIKLSRNFGQHSALVAGLEAVRGDYAVVMDADLQDDPRFIPQLLTKALEGYDVVHTRRDNLRWGFRKLLSHSVYRLLTISAELRRHNAFGNYKLISRRALNATLQHHSSRPLFELMVQMAGFPSTSVSVDRRSRPVDASAYRLGASISFVTGLLLNYSNLVFRVMLTLGSCLLAGSAAGLILADSGAVKTITLAACGIVIGALLVISSFLGFYIRTLQIQQRRWPNSIVETTV